MPHSLLETDQAVSPPPPLPERSDPVRDMAAILRDGGRLAVLLDASAPARADFLDRLTHRLEADGFRVLRAASVDGTPFDLKCLMYQVIRADDTDGADPVEQFYAALTRPEADETRLALIIDDADRLTEKTLGYLDLLASTAGLTPLPLQFVLAGGPALWGLLPENGHLSRNKVAIRLPLPDRELPPPEQDRPQAKPEMPAPAPIVASEAERAAPDPAPDPLPAAELEPVAPEPALLNAAPPFEAEDWLRTLPAPVQTAAATPLPERRPANLRLATVAVAVVAALGLGVLYWRNHSVDGAWLDTLQTSPKPAVTAAATPPDARKEAPAPPSAAIIAEQAPPPVAGLAPPPVAQPAPPPIAERAPPPVTEPASPPAPAPTQATVLAAPPPDAPEPPTSLPEPAPAAATAPPVAAPPVIAAPAIAPPPATVASTPSVPERSVVTVPAPSPSAPTTAQAEPRVAPQTAPPAPASVPTPLSSQVPASRAPAAAETKTLSPAVMATLLARGQTLISTGDVTAARQMFERAAAAGSAPGAVALGMTYDPRFLAQINAQGITPDPQRAAVWYRHAAALGSTDGSALLNQLDGLGGH